MFKSYTSSFYGLELWFHNLSVASLRKIAVTYHKAVKRVCGLNVWDSNHAACDAVGVSIFQHLHAQRLVKHLFSVISSGSPCMKHLVYYFKYQSNICRETKNFFWAQYGVSDLLNQPICALMSRISYVQRNEPRISDLRVAL